MKVTMLDTRYGSCDGFAVQLYSKDREYDLPDALASNFLRKGFAYNSEPFIDKDFSYV